MSAEHPAVVAVTGLLVVGGSLFFLVTALAMLRSRDAVSRVNSLSPATGMGLPLIIIGAFVHHTAHEGWSSLVLLKAVLSVLASLVVSSVASNVLARSVYRSQQVTDPATRADALAEAGARTEHDPDDAGHARDSGALGGE